MWVDLKTRPHKVSTLRLHTLAYVVRLECNDIETSKLNNTILIPNVFVLSLRFIIIIIVGFVSTYKDAQQTLQC